jgi:hypothetical protein
VDKQSCRNRSSQDAMALSLVHVRSEEAPAELPKCLARLVQVTSPFQWLLDSPG